MKTVVPSGGLIANMARNPVAANLIMGILLIGGFAAALNLRSEVFPQIDPRIVSVTVAYPGATPSEVEEGITRRVEEAVTGIEGVERVLSKASENVGTITIEIKDFVDPSRVRDDVEAAVDRIADFPPEEAEQPEITQADLSSDVMTLVVSSTLGERALRAAALDLQEQLLALPAVTLVELQGERSFEIAIEVDEAALRRYDLSLEAVALAVRSASMNLSSGEIRTASGDLLLRTNAKRERGPEFANIVLRSNPDGSLLRLADVAHIHDGFEDADLITQVDGAASLFVLVRKSEAEDTLDIANQVKTLLAQYQPPAGARVDVFNDSSEILQSRLSLLVRNGVLGFALVFLFLVVMLDLKLALWVAMGVPVSFLGAILFFGFLGVTINMVSLFALIIVLGIVVDDAIVVGENIASEHEDGNLGVDGAIAGAHGVRGPVVVGVLTTIAAFAPLLLATGNFGAVLSLVPIVVIMVLTMSLVEVFIILPSHLSHGEPWSRGALARVQVTVARQVQRFRDNLLVPFITAAVRRRLFTIFCAGAILLFAFSLLVTGGVRFIFFPALPADSISASLEMPIGTPFATTRAAADQIIAAAHRVNQQHAGGVFESVSATIGGRLRSGGGPGGSTGTSISRHSATVRIQLTPETNRNVDSIELERQWRREVGQIAGIESLSFAARFFDAGPEIDYELSHQNDATLLAAANYLKARIATLPGATEVQDTFAAGKRQFDITLTHAGEAAGLQPVDIARQLRRSFFGDEVQRIQRGREELKVMVRYPADERRSVQNLYNTRIRLADGSQAPLSTVARLTESRSFSEINRIDGRRVVSVTAKVDTAIATPDEANAQVEAMLPEFRQRFPGISATQGGSARDQSQDLASLGETMVIALMVIYALLAAQLRSYLQPLVILAAIPFGAGGALIGHWLLGFNLSFISIFGMIALSGVVVNGALVLVDRYNYMRANTDMTPVEAIVEATQRRFRAIFLTTLTTALGLTPMLLETSIQAQFLVPMAVSLATGIVFASVVVLFLVPALIVLLDGREGRAGRTVFTGGPVTTL